VIAHEDAVDGLVGTMKGPSRSAGAIVVAGGARTPRAREEHTVGVVPGGERKF
jgi:hypothetical protein